MFALADEWQLKVKFIIAWSCYESLLYMTHNYYIINYEYNHVNL